MGKHLINAGVGGAVTAGRLQVLAVVVGEKGGKVRISGREESHCKFGRFDATSAPRSL